MKNRNRFLLLVAFISGMCVMAMEISAARLIAPFFGTSIFVWTNIIGVVLIALSFGYYFGGKYADRKPNIEAILVPMLVAGVIFMAVPWIVKPFASIVTLSVGTSSSAIVIVVGSFLLTLVLFAVPMFLLGMVSPFVIKLFEVRDQYLGEMAGSVFAVSTIGSILGTFLPSLLFIPWVGTRMTIMLFASLLILLAVIGLSRKKSKWLMLPALLLIIFSSSSARVSSAENVIFEDESVYQFISIDQQDGRLFLRFNEGFGVQSMYDPNSVETGLYYDEFAMLPEFFDVPSLDIAILGLAGGSISRQMPDYSSIDGVEIDGKVIQAAKEYFSIEQPNLTIFKEDGRMFIANRSDAYDLVIVDAYAQQLYIPWTMTTQEFWRDVQNSMREGGLVAVNVNAASSDAPLLRAMQNTLASVFEEVYVYKTGEVSWNYMIVAGDRKIEQADERFEKVMFDSEQVVLTDDRAPVEFMTDKMIFDYLRAK